MTVSKIEEFVMRDPPDDSLEECDELVLDGCKVRTITPEDSAFLRKFKSLKTLCMNQCNLQTVAGLPELPELETLELHDNRIGEASQIETIVKLCPNLKTLYMAGNKILDLAALLPLQNLTSLTELDVEMNPATMKDKDAVRMQLFQMFPNLEIVNGCDKLGREVCDSSSSEDEDSNNNNADGFINDDDSNRITKGDNNEPLKDCEPRQSLLATLYGKALSDSDEEYNPDSESSNSDSEEEESCDSDYSDDDDESSDEKEDQAVQEQVTKNAPKSEPQGSPMKRERREPCPSEPNKSRRIDP